MDQFGLKKEVLDKIYSDPLLSGKVAFVLGITTASLPRLLIQNHSKLTQAAVLRVLRDHLGVKQDKDLLTEIKIKEVA